MIRAIAIDDEPPALRIIENFSMKTDIISLKKTFTEPREALYYISSFPVDLLFLDIQMPSVSGFEFLKKSGQKTLIIFTTAFSEYAVAGFNVNAVDFLLKPFTFERFQQAVDKAAKIFTSQAKSNFQNSTHFFIRSGYSLVKVNIEEILYIEGYDDYIKIHLDKKNHIITRMTMTNIIEKLPATDFLRIHRSYIVPLKKVERVHKNTVTIAGNEVPIGKTYKDILNGNL
ncbi:MAG: LytTR family DNA-binding domain-containing protein [Bacteroidales bacterium]|nr:LytTR family DNA-binding domain-containing protein [Bacteroidales bacterium]